MTGADLRKRWRLSEAGGFGERTSCGETAALRQARHVGNHALDGGKMRGAMIKTWNRTEQADRVGMLWACKQRIDAGAFDDLAGIHHRDFVADLGDHAE